MFQTHGMSSPERVDLADDLESSLRIRRLRICGRLCRRFVPGFPGDHRRPVAIGFVVRRHDLYPILVESILDR